VHMFDDINAINVHIVDIASEPHYDSQVTEKLVSSLPQQFKSCLPTD
jgi:hypothetical protein